MEPRVTRPGGRSARIREAVLAAAWGLIDEGRTQASLPEVAERAGVAPSSLYRRWGSWESLVAEALLEQSEVSIPVPDTGAVRTDLIAFAEALAAFLSTPRGAGVLRSAATVERTPGLDEARTQFWGGRLRRARVMIERGVERGELRPDTDARLLLEMVIAPLHLRQLLLGEDPTTSIADQVDLLLDGSRTAP